MWSCIDNNSVTGIRPSHKGLRKDLIGHLGRGRDVRLDDIASQEGVQRRSVDGHKGGKLHVKCSVIHLNLPNIQSNFLTVTMQKTKMNNNESSIISLLGQ